MSDTEYNAAAEVEFDALEEKLVKGNALVFARSATVGGQKFPVHWSGDCTANYQSMAESLRGSTAFSQTHGYMSLPLMVKENSLLAIGNKDTKPDYDYAQGVTLHLFVLKDGKSATATVVDVQGRVELEACIRREGGTLTVDAAGAGKSWSCA